MTTSAAPSTSTALETHVAGDPAAFHAAATFLRDGIGSGEQGLADDSLAQRSGLAGWEGHAGEAFGRRAKVLARSADQAAALARGLAGHLDDTGDVLVGVQAGMAELRASALAAGLTVIGTRIERPTFVVGEALAHQSRMDAWSTTTATHTALLTTWFEAVDGLAASIAAHGADLFSAASDLLVAGYTANLLARRASVLSAHAVELDALAKSNLRHADFTLSWIRAGHPDALGHYDSLIRSSRDAADAADDARVAAADPSAKLPGPVRAGFGSVAVLTTGFGVYADVHYDGESLSQAVVSQGAGLAVGTAVGFGVGFIAGSVVPGAGNAAGAAGGAAIASTIAGAVAGGAAAYGTDAAIDKYGYGETGKPDDDGFDPQAPEPGNGDAVLSLLMEATDGETGDSNGGDPGLAGVLGADGGG